jgi:hypothetical protein
MGASVACWHHVDGTPLVSKSEEGDKPFPAVFPLADIRVGMLNQVPGYRIGYYKERVERPQWLDFRVVQPAVHDGEISVGVDPLFDVTGTQRDAAQAPLMASVQWLPLRHMGQYRSDVSGLLDYRVEGEHLTILVDGIVRYSIKRRGPTEKDPSPAPTAVDDDQIEIIAKFGKPIQKGDLLFHVKSVDAKFSLARHESGRDPKDCRFGQSEEDRKILGLVNPMNARLIDLFQKVVPRAIGHAGLSPAESGMCREVNSLLPKVRRFITAEQRDDLLRSWRATTVYPNGLKKAVLDKFKAGVPIPAPFDCRVLCVESDSRGGYRVRTSHHFVSLPKVSDSAQIHEAPEGVVEPGEHYPFVKKGGEIARIVCRAGVWSKLLQAIDAATVDEIVERMFHEHLIGTEGGFLVYEEYADPAIITDRRVFLDFTELPVSDDGRLYVEMVRPSWDYWVHGPYDFSFRSQSANVEIIPADSPADDFYERNVNHRHSGSKRELQTANSGRQQDGSRKGRQRGGNRQPN